ncbi:SpvB/TcaC N-terminal domain-containing protein [Collimonas antrihumi]|uniref:SpvB/TcaC N-terminal domain-containing protein n=1 Tax=Collimonas antrihumi TaxID=1940615 RepID=UPI001B8B64AE|nr:SpvB/TcaC N-terminal domain-containing protein [Collimonas antrihumi]
MPDLPGTSNKSNKSPDGAFGATAPAITLPKGGGAIRGMGEKFATNPVTGTGVMSVPIATSPGRSGFSPQLSLSYDSGSGNGPFGIGWNLSLPAITRKTDKGLPQYQDAEESDVFILSGTEDLVAVLKKNPDGSWAHDQDGKPTYDEELRNGYVVKRYRPRIEGLFARIERWTRLSDGDTHWRSISKDNVLTVYGSTPESRIADPANPSHIFSWLICESYDDKGNAITYAYVAENDDDVDLSQINERNRVRSANRYLKYIRYGNRQPLLIDPSRPSFRQPHMPTPDFGSAGWMFEVVFDYGEGHYQETPADADGRTFATAMLKPPIGGAWPARLDPFSTYRPCFEVRSYRLCRRVLMFHHFPDELSVDDYLVRSTEFAYSEKANGSFITQALQSGFKRIAQTVPRYLKRSLPPLEFTYSASPLDDLSYDQLPLQEVNELNLQSLPAGIDGNSYRWVDLNGEGISGVLSEQADAWFYKPNLGEGQFGPIEYVSPRPSLAALSHGRQQLLNLAGDGNLALVEFGSPTPGFFSRTDDASWDRFRTFLNLPNLDWQDPNLRFVDLTGDGHADILVTNDQVFATWYESKAVDGFCAAAHVPLASDEEKGPRLVFSDGTQSIFLADMSGDGLSDLVRIRVSEVCYWPNIGYGRFGAKVSMDNVPWFDDVASFDQRRIHLTDTDGSGPTDIIYLGRDGVRIYLNQHGNSLSAARQLNRVPRTDQLSSVSVVDFLGRGTACLLWSSPLPGDTRRCLRYLDLMNGVKPHLLTTVRNNLGAETSIEYASSTHFYLADKAAGTPWITRLPFPVHVVTRVETRDLISGNRFVTRSTYHHGCFDGIEREFRGFGRVDQWDTEEFGVLSQAVAGTPASNLNAAFHVPPTLTKTWFHTGAYLAGKRISRHFEDEYYREGDPGRPGEVLSPIQRKAMLLDDTVLPADLASEEAAEAIRSLKGAMLRQEIYALDGTDAAGRPYSVAEHNYTIQAVQPRGANLHAVFFTHAREAVDFHYERKLFPVLNGQIVDAVTATQNPATKWLADPRVTHTVILDADDYGNVRQSVTIAYGRRFDDADPVLTDADRKKQKQLFATLGEDSFTNAVLAADAYRTPLPAEAQTYELLKLRPGGQQPDITNLFRFDELIAIAAQAEDGAHDLPYEDINATQAMGGGVYRRPIEVQRTRYRSNNLSQLLPLQTLQALALPGESYKLAFTAGLLSSIYQRPHAGLATENLLSNPGTVLPVDASLASDRGGYVDLDGDGRWWHPSGRVFFHPSETATAADELVEAAGHFFLPRRIRNPFADSSFVDYANDLFPAKTRDPLGNSVEALHDYRVLQAKQLTDPNGNRSFVAFDAFGLAVATAVRGKSNEALGDSLDDFGDFDANPSLLQLQSFAARPADFKAALLKNATSRFVYDLDRYRRCGEPPFAATLVRETHVSDPVPPQGLQIQVSFAYFDGFGRELQSKIQAEPGDAAIRAGNVMLASGDVSPGALTLNNGVPVSGAVNPRWVGKGRTVYNNKGKPVKQYEPFFSSTQLYEAEPEMTDTGVTPILFYDPAERVVATLHPNHTYEKVVFDPWRQESWDVNDTVTLLDPKTDPDVGEFFQLLPVADYLPTWYDQRRNGQRGADEKAAADKAAAHAATPIVAYFDTLGRPMLTVADNGKDGNGVAQKYATRVTLDIEGNQREVKDASNRIVMRYGYDMLGNHVHQSSMEAGQRWMLNDVTGKAIRSWDDRGHSLRSEYDELRRPLRSYVIGADLQNPTREICFEETVYGEFSGNGLTAAQILQANLRAKPYKHYDTAGIVTSEAHDFKGNLLRSSRQLVQDYKATPDWSQNPSPVLETDIFASSTSYDALNRPIQLIAPHSNQASTKINIMRPGYNEANLLERVDAWLGLIAEPSTLLDPTSANLHAVTNIDYDAKGQRSRIDYGNGAQTEYFYDEQSFRLIHLKTSRTGAAPQNFMQRLLSSSAPQVTSIFQDLFYTYDPAGNITRIRDDVQQTTYFNGQVVLPQCDYVYDAIYRLINATGREHIGQLAQPQTSWNDEFRINLPQPGDGQAMRNYTEQYLYDAVGNFEQLIHQAANGNWTRTYAYNEASLIEAAKHSNRLSSTAIGATAESYSYDVHGNMTSMPHLTLMQWDFRDQLSATSRQAVNATPPPNIVPETTFYLYDGGGQRVRKVTERQNGSRKSERIYLGDFEIYREFDGTGAGVALERETLHVMDHKQRVALVETRTQGKDGSPLQLMRYQFGNHLGSASLELDDSGDVISYEEYTPYGSTSYQAVDQGVKAAAKRYRYTGKERDDETGFNYHGARYFVSWLGRWIRTDPNWFADGTNLYVYVRNTPTILNDPTGRQAPPRPAPYRPLVIPPPPPPEPPKINVQRYIDLGEPMPPEKPLTRARLPQLRVVIVRAPNGPLNIAPKLGDEPIAGYTVAPYKMQPNRRSVETPLEAHHGVMNELASRLVFRYSIDAAPTVLLTREAHRDANAAFETWKSQLDAKYKVSDGKTQRQNVNWDLVARDPKLVRDLSESQFDAAKVSKEVRTEYYRQFEIYKENQEYKRQEQEYETAKSLWNIEYGPAIVPYVAPTPE